MVANCHFGGDGSAQDAVYGVLNGSTKDDDDSCFLAERCETRKWIWDVLFPICLATIRGSSETMVLIQVVLFSSFCIFSFTSKFLVDRQYRSVD